MNAADPISPHKLAEVFPEVPLSVWQDPTQCRLYALRLQTIAQARQERRAIRRVNSGKFIKAILVALAAALLIAALQPAVSGVLFALAETYLAMALTLAGLAGFAAIQFMPASKEPSSS